MIFLGVIGGNPGYIKNMNTTQREKSVKELLLGKTWSYLNDNFHKFKQAQKIKIALALCVKDIPQEVEGLQQQIIIMNDIIKNNSPHRYNLGSITTPENSGHPGQNPPDS